MVSMQIMSDLHLEWHADGGKEFVNSLPVCADTLILAGDICGRVQIEQVLGWFAAKWKNIIYVTGNHEYYGTNLQGLNETRTRVQKNLPNVQWLDMSTTQQNEQSPVIHGATLWFNDYPTEPRTIYDFKAINNFEPMVYDIHRTTRTYLYSQVKKGDIIVTHHTPSYQSMAEQYKNFQGNCWFHNNLEGLIFAAQPRLWVHGHTHMSLDYTIDNTRVVCNPYGYLGHDENPYFKEDLVIEIT